MKTIILFGVLMKRKLIETNPEGSFNKRSKPLSSASGYSIKDYFTFYVKWIDSVYIIRAIEEGEGLQNISYHFNELKTSSKKSPKHCVNKMLSELAYFGLQYSALPAISEELTFKNDENNPYDKLGEVYHKYITPLPTKQLPDDKKGLQHYSLADIFDGYCSSRSKQGTEVDKIFEFELSSLFYGYFRNYKEGKQTPSRMLKILSYHPQFKEIKEKMIQRGLNEKLTSFCYREGQFNTLKEIFIEYRPDAQVLGNKTPEIPLTNTRNSLNNIGFFSNSSYFPDTDQEKFSIKFITS